uniref:Uncharacterized protein n=1 Tax=Globodera rostochiensis TaxID=31243 RepID=A0A914HS66_GLORO
MNFRASGEDRLELLNFKSREVREEQLKLRRETDVDYQKLAEDGIDEKILPSRIGEGARIGGCEGSVLTMIAGHGKGDARCPWRWVYPPNGYWTSGGLIKIVPTVVEICQEEKDSQAGQDDGKADGEGFRFLRFHGGRREGWLSWYADLSSNGAEGGDEEMVEEKEGDSGQHDGHGEDKCQ